MTAVAQRTRPHDRFPEHSVLWLATAVVMTVLGSLMLCVCMAVAILGAADAAGVDIPIAAPSAHPSVAPPGLDR